MKILLDPIYTTLPSRCASTIKMVRVFEHLSEKYDDAYFYWIVPNDLPAEELNWLPQSDRIMYIPLQMDEELDRYKQYSRLAFDLENVIAFDGDYWDWDILVTNKSAMVPLYRMICCKPRAQRLKWCRKIVILEDMPMMSFKGFVQTPPGDYSDYLTMLGYLTADKVAICAYWEKAKIMELAKKHFSPSSARKIGNNIVEATPSLFHDVQFKSKKTVEATINRKKPFTISFSGRLVKGHRMEEILDIMSKHWIMRNNDKHPVNCVLTSASKGVGAGIKVPEFVNVVPAPREEFWRIVKEESDVGVFLSVEEDYSMSVIEPLTMGLPIAVYKCEWSVASLGEEYPFFIKNAKEAYGVIKAFYDDYATQYKKFVGWSRNHFLPLLLERNKEYTPEIVDTQVEQWKKDLKEWGENNTTQNDLVDRLPEFLEGGQPTIFEAVEAMALTYGDVTTFLEKATTGIRSKYRLVYSTDWNSVRLTLMSKHGLKDTGVAPGAMGNVKGKNHE